VERAKTRSAESGTILGAAQRQSATAQEIPPPLRRINCDCCLHRHECGHRHCAAKAGLKLLYHTPGGYYKRRRRKIAPRAKLPPREESALRSGVHAATDSMDTLRRARAQNHGRGRWPNCVFRAIGMRTIALLPNHFCCYSPALTSFHSAWERSRWTPRALLDRGCGTLKEPEHCGVKAVF
jgi:hypothetical protein